jgi:hypothetical protein
MQIERDTARGSPAAAKSGLPPEKQIPRRMPKLNARFRTDPLRTGEVGIRSSLRILAVTAWDSGATARASVLSL